MRCWKTPARSSLFASAPSMPPYLEPGSQQLLDRTDLGQLANHRDRWQAVECVQRHDVEASAGTTERLSSRPQRHTELRRLLIRGANGPLQQACDASSFFLFASKRLEGANVLLCPRL